MAAHDRVRLHNDQGGVPISPRVGEQDPEQSISVAEWGTLGGTPEHRQLLTEREVLKRDGSVSTAEQRDGSEQDDKRSQHELCCRAIVQESNGVVGDLVLAKDSGQYFQPRLTPLISAREFQLGKPAVSVLRLEAADSYSYRSAFRGSTPAACRAGT